MKLSLKKLSVFFLILLLFIANPSFITNIIAASSPWTQSDWSGGNFSLAEQITTSTPNQTTLDTSEKLSNTGFETDLTGWSQTAENTAGTFTDSNFSADSAALAAWPLDETTTTQSYSRVINPAVATGRNIVINGTFDTDTTWVKGTGWTISGGTGVATAAVAGQNMTQTVPFVSGKSYTVTYDLVVTSGSLRIGVGSSGNGTTRTTSGTYTETIVAGSTGTFYLNPVATFTGTVDNVTVAQINIPASTATSATQLLTDGDMEAAGTGSWTAGNSAALSKQTTSPHGGSQVLRVTRNVTASPYAKQTILTVGQVYRVTGYARGDGAGSPSTPHVLQNSAGTTLFSGTTSSAWQPFDVVFVANSTDIDFGSLSLPNGGYVEFDDVVVSADNYIRPGELVQDRDMETAGTGYWPSPLFPGTITKDTTSPHSGTQNLRIARDGTNNNPAADQIGVFALGKTYLVTGWYKTDGTAIVQMNDGITNQFSGAATTTWTYFDKTFVATGTRLRLQTVTSTGTQYSEWDDVSVTEVDPLVGRPTNGVTLGTTAGGHLTTAYSFDGSNDYVNIYSSDLNSAFNPNEGTMVAWAKVSGAGMWTDATTRRIVFAGFDNSTNLIGIYKGSSNNTLGVSYIAGSVAKSVFTTTSSTDWMQIVITWSKSNDQVIAYFNGTQSGSTLTGLGTWSGNLSSTNTEIGANASGLNPWSGLINDVRLYNSALTPTQIANLYNGYTVTRDTGTKYAGTASLKTVTEGHTNADVVQSVNVGNTQNYYLSAYAYTNGSAVTSSDVELFYNGATVPTTYTSVGSGWYQLTGTVAGANTARNYGVQIKSGKTVYIDNTSLKASSGTLTSSIFGTGTGSNGTDYGTVTFSATTPANTTASVKVRTSDDSSMSTALDFSSCNLLSSGANIPTSTCVINGERYVQYQIILSNTDGVSTPTFNSISLNFGTRNLSVPPPACTDTTPSSAPIITSVTPIDQNTLRLVFTKAGSPVSYYALEYGDTSGNYKWGVPSFGDANTTSYNAGFLTPNTTYYFKVRAGNGCAPGPWSSEASGTTSLASITTTTTSGIVPSAPKIPVSPSPTPTTGPGTGPLPPEKPGGITLPTIDTKPISEFIKNNLNALASFWETLRKDYQQGLIALQQYFEGFKQKSLSLIASILTRTGNEINTISGNIAYQTSILSRITNRLTIQETEIYMKNIETSVKISTNNIQSFGLGISNILNKSNSEYTSFLGRSQTTLASLIQSILNTISRTTASVANAIGKSIAVTTRAIDSKSKELASIVIKTTSNIVAATGSVSKSIIRSVGNQIALVSNSVTKTAATSLNATNKELVKLTNTINAQFTLVSQATNKALTRVQTFLAITGEYWFNSEPTKILAVDVASTSPTSAVITWQTNQFASSAINYGFDTSYGQRAQSDQLVKNHKIEITNLEPNKTYFFEVMSQGKDYVHDSYYTFQTAGGQTQIFKKTKVEIIGNQNDWILVRNAPTKEGEIIAKVQVGQTFQFLMEKNSWFLIKLDGSEGWISKEFGKLTQ